MVYFLKEDLALLEDRIKETIAKIEEVGNELRLATTQSSETWHDNFGFENAQQQARLLSRRLDDLEQLRRSAITVEHPKDFKTVAIGHKVIVADAETGETKTFHIGSYVTFTAHTISYASPIGLLLLNKKIGQHAKGAMGTKQVEFEIIDIA